MFSRVSNTFQVVYKNPLSGDLLHSSSYRLLRSQTSSHSVETTMLPIFILCFVSIEHCLIRCQAEGSVSAPRRTYAGSRDEQVRQLNEAGKTSTGHSLLGFNSRDRVDSHHVSTGHFCRDDTTSRRTNTQLEDAVSAQTLAGNQRKGRQPARSRSLSARPSLMRRLPAVASPAVTNVYQLAASQRVSAQARPDPPARTPQVGQRGAKKPSASPGNRMFRKNYQGGSKPRKTVSPTIQRIPSQMSPAQSARAQQTLPTPRTVVGYTTQSPVPYNTIFPIAVDTGATARRKAPRPTTPAPSQPRSSRPGSSYRAAQSSQSLSSNPRTSRRGGILTKVIQTGQKTDASKLPIYIKFPVGRRKYMY